MTDRRSSVTFLAGRRGTARTVVIATVASAVLLFLGFLLMQRNGEKTARPATAAAQAVDGKIGKKAEAPASPEDASQTSKESPPSPTAAPVSAGEKTEGPAGATFSGTVRVAGTGEPAPGVIVVVRREAPTKDDSFLAGLRRAKVEESDRSAPAGADGRYEIEGVPPGEHRAFALRGETDFVTLPPAKGKTFTVGPDLAGQTIDFEVDPGGTIRGRALDSAGQPIAGAKVSAPDRDFISSIFDLDSGFQGMNETVSKEDGTYRIAGLPLDKVYMLHAEAKDKTRTLIQDLTFGEGEREIEMDIVLQAGSTVSGRVVDDGGKPVEGAEVTLSAAELQTIFEILPAKTARTDPAGAFRIEMVPAGKYELTSGDPGRAVIRAVECDGEAEVADLILTLPPGIAVPPEGLSVTGRVVDDLGQPVADAQLVLTGFSVGKGPYNGTKKSDADGSFAFRDLPQGLFNLQASRDGYAPFLRTGLAPIPDPIEVTLQRTARVRGTVTARRTGEPIEGAVVKVSPVGGQDDLTRLMAGQALGDQPSAKCGADGTFTIEKVAPGSIRIRAEASGFAPGVSKDLTVAPAAEAADVTVELSKGGTIRGIVVGPGGKLVADATVQAQECVANSMEDQRRKMMPILFGVRPPGGKTEADGAFAIRHLQEGKFAVAASHPDFAPSEESIVAIGLDERRDGVRLRLRPPATLRVRVTDKGKAMPGLMVQVLGDGFMKMLTTDPDGGADFVSLPAGPYMVQVINLGQMMSGKGLGMSPKVAEVGEGQSLDFPIRLGEGAKVHGKVLGKLSGPMNMVVIALPEPPKTGDLDPLDFKAQIRAARYNMAVGFVNPDGTYQVEDVPDGDFTISIPRLPSDLGKAATMTPEGSTPYCSEPLKVSGGQDVEKDLQIEPPRAGGPDKVPPKEPPAAP